MLKLWKGTDSIRFKLVLWKAERSQGLIRFLDGDGTFKNFFPEKYRKSLEWVFNKSPIPHNNGFYRWYLRQTKKIRPDLWN